MDSIQLGAEGSEGSSASHDSNLSSTANAPGAGERSSAMMVRPDWVPEKFFKEGVIDYRAMGESYVALEKRQGSQAQTKAPEDAAAADTTPAVEPTPAPEPPAVPGIEPARVKHFTEELKSAGKLSDKSYDELVKLGYPKQVVDAYVRGLNVDQEISQHTLATKQIDEIKASVGGEEALNGMLGWARQNWTAQDQKAYNDAVSSGDAATVRLAVKGLKAEYEHANGTQPNYLSGRKPAGVGGLAPFQNEQEVAKAIAHPDYRTSETYRQQVADRLKNSDVFRNSRQLTKK